jgi:hypothetical protein
MPSIPSMPSTPDGGEWSASRPKAIRRLLLERRLGGPHKMSGHCGEQRNLLPPNPPLLNTTIGREKHFQKKIRYRNFHILIKTKVRFRAFIGMTSDTI